MRLYAGPSELLRLEEIEKPAPALLLGPLVFMFGGMKMAIASARPDGIGFAADREETLGMRRNPFVVRYFSMRYLFAQKEVMDQCAENAANVAAPWSRS